MSVERAPGAPVGYDLRIRIRDGETPVFGPGKLALLREIERTGSISAAARELGMSYRRAWLLVDAMNHAFREPLVARHIGGAAGGGAALTPLGQSMASQYEALISEMHEWLDDRIETFANVIKSSA
ncbi:Molybdenum-pterin-binding protein MopB [Pandoraea terrae]|uniref:Molybdenum-pterin-binding protein MopB n=1 Tax=Pandoraea terrae TaxID=1537710 RepID=A0A5E4UPX7_9BURK|nr:LysR family transcriptional regulator [Pandoraea terrae]VVE01996.1 Molybdenum-pterin-binding protein MopB [Pandoraea terrae]